MGTEIGLLYGEYRASGEGLSTGPVGSRKVEQVARMKAALNEMYTWLGS